MRALLATVWLQHCGVRSPPPTVAAEPVPLIDPAPGPQPPSEMAHSDRPVRAELLYFAMVDRFAPDQAKSEARIDPADPHGFHGGDLDGVRAYLDHLRRLCITRLWLTPVFEMREDKIGEWGAFHGYWVRDLTQISPRFGAEPALEALGAAAGERGIELVLDMVWNHTDHDAPLRAQHPDWFHGRGDVLDWDDPEQRETHDVHGLPDLAQEQPEVAAWLLEASVPHARRTGVGGFRVDAVGHMPNAFLADMAQGIRAQVDPDFWLVGEDFVGAPHALAQTQRESGFDAVFDFPFRYAAVDVFCRDAPVSRLAGVFGADRFYDRPHGLVTFLDNHDMPRVLTECAGDRGGVRQALALQFASRGIPALTWGTELWLDGGEEPDNRKDMPWERLGGPDDQTGDLAALAQLRARSPALYAGDTQLLGLEGQVLTLARVHPEQAAVVVINRSAQRQVVALPAWLVGGTRLGGSVVAGTRLRVERSPEGIELGGQLSVPAGAVLVYVLDPVGAPPASWAAAPPQGARTVRVQVCGLPPQANRAALVGSGPELGNWQPADGISLAPEANGCHGGMLTLPFGAVAEYKFVALAADASATWETGSNRVWWAQQGGTGDGPPPARFRLSTD